MNLRPFSFIGLTPSQTRQRNTTLKKAVGEGVNAESSKREDTI